MTEKRFEVVMNEFDEVEYIMDKVTMEDRDFAEFIKFVEDVCKENEQLNEKIRILEKENGGMKGAFKRKFDYNIEDVVDEVYGDAK